MIVSIYFCNLHWHNDFLEKNTDFLYICIFCSSYCWMSFPGKTRLVFIWCVVGSYSSSNKGWERPAGTAFLLLWIWLKFPNDISKQNIFLFWSGFETWIIESPGYKDSSSVHCCHYEGLSTLFPLGPLVPLEILGRPKAFTRPKVV